MNSFDLNYSLKLEAAVTSHSLLTIVVLVDTKEERTDLTELKIYFKLEQRELKRTDLT